MISDEDFERELQFVRVRAAGAQEGVLGPGSATWKIDREAAIFLGAGRALLLQLAHPWVATAIGGHSRVFADPIGRFHRTFSVQFALVFGTLDQALATARRLRARHAAITGVMPKNAGPFAAGSAYCANDASAMLWVHATLVDTALIAHDLILPPFTPVERARYYAESRVFAGLYGIPQAILPETWEDFAAYAAAMWDSETLTVTADARLMADQLWRGKNVLLRAPAWYRAVTARMLPPRLRTAFALPYGEAEQRLSGTALFWLRQGYAALPQRLRFVGPYQEAQARLSGKPGPDLLNQCVNQFWIGRRQLAKN
jgi:uncharacterized protein (DUF2236 family)